MPTNIFQVPQRKVPVRIRFGDGRLVMGTFYVPDVGPDGAPGRLIDRLNSDEESFLPLTCGAGQCIVSKVEMDSIELTAGAEDPPSEEDAAAEYVLGVRFTLRQGEGIEGRIRFAAPPERRRLLDYLNSAPAFIRVNVDGGTTYLAKRAIVTVAEVDAPPA